MEAEVKIKDLKATIGSLNDELRDTNQAIGIAHTQRDGLLVQKDSLSKDLHNLIGQINDLSGKVETKKDLLGKIDKDIALAKNAKSQAEHELTSLGAKKRSIEASVRNLQAKEKALKDIEHKLTNANHQLSGLQQSLVKAQSSLAKKQEELRETNQSIKEQEALLSKTKKTIKEEKAKLIEWKQAMERKTEQNNKDSLDLRVEMENKKKDLLVVEQRLKTYYQEHGLPFPKL